MNEDSQINAQASPPLESAPAPPPPVETAQPTPAAHVQPLPTQIVELKTLAPVLPKAQSVLTRKFDVGHRVLAIEAEPGVEIVGIRIGRRAVARAEHQTWSEAMRADRGVPAGTYLSILVRSTGVADKRVLVGRAVVVIDPTVPAAAPSPPPVDVQGSLSVEAPPVIPGEVVTQAAPSGTREAPRTVTGTLGGPRTGGYGSAGEGAAFAPTAPTQIGGDDLVGTRKDPRHIQGTTNRRNVEVNRTVKSSGGAARHMTSTYRRESGPRVTVLKTADGSAPRAAGEQSAVGTVAAAPAPALTSGAQAVPGEGFAAGFTATPIAADLGDAPPDMLAMIGLTPEEARGQPAAPPPQVAEAEPSGPFDPALRHLRPGDMHMMSAREGERVLALDRGIARNLIDAIEHRTRLRPAFQPTLVRCLMLASKQIGARAWGKGEAPIVLKDAEVASLHRFALSGHAVTLEGAPAITTAIRAGLARAAEEDRPARAGQIVEDTPAVAGVVVEARAS